MSFSRIFTCTLFMASFALGQGNVLADVTLVRDGEAQAVIHVPERLWDDPQQNPEPSGIWRSNPDEEALRRRLRESVRDFAAILKRMSGAAVEIEVGAPEADDPRVPILVGELARERFGEPQRSYPYEQGFRIVVNDDAVGLIGESDLGTSYALYTLLHELGCRWYMPSAMGEVLPEMTTITLTGRDESTGPYTIYRGVWYADNDYARRNRMGGMALAAGHALEYTVPEELRESHPEIRAVIDGEPHAEKVKWTHPLVAEALSDTFLERLEETPDTPTFSLSPIDGIGWDEALDPEYDAGDFDSSTGTVSKTDRLLVLANRVAETVTAEYPEVLFGILAYVDYTRPPKRETPHPNVVPQIAPITYARAHPMSDDGEPNNAELRYIVEGWGDVAEKTSYYFYGWFLAELSSPNPMITKWSQDIPFIYEHGACRFWQPETITNFESSMHALYLGVRMAWDPSQEPAEIIDELHRNFYGHATEEMAAYWHYVDSVWVDVPEYSGAGWGHRRRFTPERMSRMRELLEAGKAAARTDTEQARIRMADESLTMFERFMQMRHDLAEGRFANLAEDAESYMADMKALGEQYADQFAFGKVRWASQGTVNNSYFNSFYKQTYDDADRIATDYALLTPTIRAFRYRADEQVDGEAAGWVKPDHDDSDWSTTDVTRDTWSALGLHNYLGEMWYRTTVDLPDIEEGQRVRLWLGATDGSVKVFVNGEHVPFINEEGESTETFSGYADPVSFDVTDAARPGEPNQITLLCERQAINELGTGGLMGPMRFYTDH